MFEPTVREGVLRLRREGTRWLSTGVDGGLSTGDVAYNVSVPEGWDRTDLGEYVAGRLRRAGFGADGPALLTGVDLVHARGARSPPVEAYATAGLSNPAGLPMDPPGGGDGGENSADPGGDDAEGGPGKQAGTVNLVVGTTRSLPDGGLAELLATVVEAKAATLLQGAGFTGTTTDAAVVACDPGGEPATFAGAATPVGAAARACVREAVRASLRSRYADRELPASVEDAAYGAATERRAEVFELRDA